MFCLYKNGNNENFGRNKHVTIFGSNSVQNTTVFICNKQENSNRMSQLIVIIDYI